MAKTFNLKTGAPQESSFLIEYSKLLNSSQLEAVTSFNGPVLCIAGAGSGKTRTLVFRVARMIESQINPNSILLLTFTRKAAQRMLQQAAQITGERVKSVAGGTYHSFAANILRKHGALIGIKPGFSIIDESDSADIINLLRTELGFNSNEIRFPQKKTLAQMFSKSQNLQKSIADILEEFYPQFMELSEQLTSLFSAFQNYKLEHSLLGYDDLLIYLLKLLQESEEARLIINKRYQYVMADEYQDTNLIQAQITYLLGGPQKNIMVVGDDAQSIYSFRGAKIDNILRFPKDFPECRIIRLEQNYRSTPEVLAAANSLMEKASEGFRKKLFTLKSNGEIPALVPCDDETEQAMFVAARILELREQNIPLSKIAVLFRSSFHAYQLELELKRRNIPYVKWGGFKFLEAAHLKDVISHLRVLQNPSDQVSWLRILLLIEGVGSRTAAEIFKSFQTNRNSFDFTATKCRPKIKEGLMKLSALLQKTTAIENPSPARLIELVSEYYFPLLKKRYDDYPKRFKDIDQLSLIAGKASSLEEFLADLALEPPVDSIDETLANKNEEQEHLILSTIHSAKGLEWHSVFVICALDGRFPSFNSLKTPQTLEEERRLMYVALTRAEQNLAITYPSQIWDPVSGNLLSRVSRFIEDISPDLLERWSISRQ